MLIASPQMQDPFFERTVVLIWHYDEDGAIGVVVNRNLKHTLPEVLDIEQPVDLSHYEETSVGWGGPVDSASGTVIARGEVQDEEGWMLPGGISVTRSQDALLRLIDDSAPLLLCLGYAGWGPGQLDKEIELGGWIWTDCDPALVFDVPVDERYDRALESLGLTTHTIWMPPIQE